jgi:hypothetical protein
MNIVYANGANKLLGMRQQDDFSYSIRETPDIGGGNTTPQTIQDCNVNTVDAVISDNNFAIDVHDSTLASGHEFINNTPTIVSCDAAGNVVKIINGTAIIDIKTPVGKRQYSRVMVSAATFQKSYWQSFVAGSLGKHIVDGMLALVAGKICNNTTTDMFTSNNYNTSAPAAVRNPSMFAAGLDLTAISIMDKRWDGITTYGHPGMLISPRHILGAAHYQAYGPIVWLDSVGAYHTATPLSYTTIPGTDIIIQYLGAAVTGITPLKVLPSDWQTYLPNLDTEINDTGIDFFPNLPCLTKIVHAPAGGTRDTMALNHFVRLTIPSPNPPWWAAWLRTDPLIAALDTERFQGPIGGGDSGGPLFLLINGELVLIGTYLSATSSANVSGYITEIEAAMNSLAAAQGDFTSYSLSKVSLAGFTSY